MALDLAQFHDAFFDESFEALDTMEAALLKLNVGAPEPELINTIFRVAHSIKGGSATFGFAEVASFTHTCETLLDELRGNRMQVTRAHHRPAAQVGRRHARHAARRAAQVADRCAARRRSAVRPRAGDRAEECAGGRCRRLPPRRPPTPVPAACSRRTSLAHPVPSVSATVRARQRSAAHAARAGGARRPDRQRRAQNLPALRRARSGVLLPRRGSSRVDTDATREVIDQVFDWAEGDCELQIRDENARRPAAAGAEACAPRTSSACRDRSAAKRRDARAAAEPARRRKQGLGDGSSIRVSTEKIDELMNTVGELVITQSMLSQLGAKLVRRRRRAVALRPGAARAQRARAAGKRHARAHAADQLRIQPLPAHGARPEPAARQAGRAEGDAATRPSSTRPCWRRSAIRSCTWCATASITASRCREARVAAGKPAAGAVSSRPITRAATSPSKSATTAAACNSERILAKARSRGLIGPNDTLTRRADLRAHLHGRLLDRRPDDRHLRPRRRHGRRATEHQGARRHDRSALDARDAARASSSRCR